MISLHANRQLINLLKIAQWDDNLYKNLYINPTKTGNTWITATNGHILLSYRFSGKLAPVVGWYSLHKIDMNEYQFIKTQEKQENVISYLNRLKHIGNHIDVKKHIENPRTMHQTTKSQIYTDIIERLLPLKSLDYTYFDMLTGDILDVKTITEYQNGNTDIVYFTGIDFKAAIAQINR